MRAAFQVSILLIGLLLSAGALAQPKAYAPEDLSVLSVPDQARVIEREYADQSGGRLVPDDQLEFYLDQVRSGWGFSQIKQDIATSLGGGRWRPASGWRPTEVTCSSVDRRYTECRAPFRGPAVLTFQFSGRPCIEGQTWGQVRGGIWVDQGCRGQFSEARGAVVQRPPALGYGSAPNYASAGIICESKQGKRRRCPTGVNGPVVLVEQYSESPCIEGDSWAWTPGEVWVTRGCRARFEVGRGRPGLPAGGYRPGYGGAVYSITCASDDGRYRTCYWDQSNGRPVLIEQLSRTACIEGQTWGYGRDGIWVDRGCRGRFEGR